jgi:hypothetical protein
MEKDIAINRVLRDMKMFELISKDIAGEVRTGEVRMFLNALWVVAQDSKQQVMQAHHTSRVVQYSLDGTKLGEYNSIEEAARAVGYKGIYGRNIIGNSLSGRHKQTKKGHIWKYAEI